MKNNVYLVELTEHKYKREDLLYYPFVIYNCFNNKLDTFTAHIETKYGKIKAMWKCNDEKDARRWREEILKMRGQEDLI